MQNHARYMLRRAASRCYSAFRSIVISRTANAVSSLPSAAGLPHMARLGRGSPIVWRVVLESSPGSSPMSSGTKRPVSWSSAVRASIFKPGMALADSILARLAQLAHALRLKRHLMETRRSYTLVRRSALPPRKRMKSLLLALTIFALTPTFAKGQVLTANDLELLSEMKNTFTKLTSELAQSFNRQDISRDESECIKSTWQDLRQTYEELSSYEYLIGIASQIDDSGNDTTTRGLIRFALDKAIAMLETERKRLSQVTDQCIRFPVSVGLSQRALQFIDGTTAGLKSFRHRL